MTSARTRRQTLHLNLDAISDRRSSWTRVAIKIVGGLIVVGALFVLFHFALEPYLAATEDYVRSLGFWGPVLYIAIFLLATTVFIPESVLAIAAGAIFGLWWGLAWVFVAGTITAVFIFVVGRNMLQGHADELLAKHPKIHAIDAAASNAGFKLIFLLRLSPLNYSLLCYLMAVSKARFKPYLLACIGMIPGNLSTVYVGFAARHAADLAKRMKGHDDHLPTGDSLIHEVTLFVGLAAAIVASVVVAKIAMRAIRKATDEAAAAD